MQLTVVHKSGKMTVLREEPAQIAGIFFEVKSTWDMSRMSRPTENEKDAGKSIIEEVLGLPDVWRLEVRNKKLPSGNPKPDFVKLDHEHAHFIVKINAEIQRGEPFASRAAYFAWWNSLPQLSRDYYIKNVTSACTHYRSHTNYYGLDNMHNPLTGERKDQDFAKFAMLVTGRWCGKAVLESSNPMRRNITPVGDCLAFECINASGDYWQFSPLVEWWLFDQPMSTAREIGKDKGGL